MFNLKATIALAGFLLLLALLPVSHATAQTRSITIGKLTYVGTGANNNGAVVSSYEILLDTTGITEEPISFSNVILFVKGTRLSTQKGGFPTITTGPGCGQGSGPPCNLLFRGGQGLILARCAAQDLTQTCISIGAQLVSLTGKNFSFALAANGQKFCTDGITNIFLRAKPNQTALEPHCNAQGFCKGASVPIILHAAPARSCSQ
jgi:hypothetical protein